MNEEIMITFLLVITLVMMIITYPTISMIVIDYAKDLEKSCRFRKLLIILSIIPIVNVLVLFVISIKMVFTDVREELFDDFDDVINKVKNEFKDGL